MKKFYYFMLLLVGAGFVAACDNGYADVTVVDSAPLVTLVDLPTSVEPGSAITFNAELQDGRSEELSSSPLASYSWTVGDTLTMAEQANGNGTVSGLSAIVPLSIPTDGWDAGVYELVFSATDTKGLTNSVGGNYITVADCPDAAATIGLIGDSTPGGWSDDTDMTVSADNPYVWTLTVDLTAAEAKFRQDNDWAINWGAADFPSGTGTQDGPNIGIPEAGTYLVELNSCSGAYTFTKQ